MEIPNAEARKLFNISTDDIGLSRWDSRTLTQVKRTGSGALVCGAIDELGVRSMKAQGLSRVITSTALLCCSEHTLFVAGSKGVVFGILKVGKKNLFIRNELGKLHEIQPLCVLDFYVHEDYQRAGVGRILFEHMLECHGDVEPRKLGYDRPSNKLLSFLRKHYNLCSYIPQNNNFVVYNSYFEPGGAGSVTGTRPPPVISAASPPRDNYNILSGAVNAPHPQGLVQGKGKRHVKPSWA